MLERINYIKYIISIIINLVISEINGFSYIRNYKDFIIIDNFLICKNRTIYLEDGYNAVQFHLYKNTVSLIMNKRFYLICDGNYVYHIVSRNIKIKIQFDNIIEISINHIEFVIINLNNILIYLCLYKSPSTYDIKLLNTDIHYNNINHWYFSSDYLILKNNFNNVIFLSDKHTIYFYRCWNIISLHDILYFHTNSFSYRYNAVTNIFTKINLIEN